MSEIAPEDGLSEGQLRALDLLGAGAKHVMLAGGTRSGKTWALIWALIARALKAPGSRHAVLRFRFGHVKQSIVHDTWPAVLQRHFPGVPCHLDRSSWFAQFENGSQVWFGGLDDKERTEKILGTEFATIYLNECSQIPWSSRNIAVTRLAQLVYDVEGAALAPRMYYDENPPDKGHWSYQLFVLHVDPDSRRRLSDPDNYAFLRLNPADNREHLSADFLATLEALPQRLRKRFLEGEFRDANPGALFDEAMFEKWRVVDGQLPQFVRIVVGIDPSGADDPDDTDHDEIGIVVAALAVDGAAYILEDLTCRAAPAVWGRVATQAFERHEADCIVAEVNFGGAMVRQVIQTARPRTPYREARASRGKSVRAEPVSALFEAGKVRLAGFFRELEDELAAFTTHGYVGDRSPNRADALVWAVAELFPELTRAPKEPAQVIAPALLVRPQPHAWMRR